MSPGHEERGSQAEKNNVPRVLKERVGVACAKRWKKLNMAAALSVKGRKGCMCECACVSLYVYVCMSVSMCVQVYECG